MVLVPTLRPPSSATARRPPALGPTHVSANEPPAAGERNGRSLPAPTLRTLIVDDDAAARERLSALLARYADVRVTAELPDGDQAAQAIAADPPDLVFLDAEMPGCGGFDVVARVGAARMPHVVFTTARDAFGLRAFEVNAVDYLLKPVREARLEQALERVRARRAAAAARALAPGSPLLPGVPPPYRDRFAVRTGDRFHVVRAADIAWIEAADNYVRLHAPAGPYLMRGTIQGIEAMLDPRRFLRIHRSIIVSLDRVKTLTGWGFGEYLFELADGTRLTSSRRYKATIRDAFAC